MPPEPEQPIRVEHDERFGRFNFQPEERLAKLADFLRSPAPSRVVVLSGAEGIGRAYLLKAAVHRLRAAGQAWDLIDLDMEGYEPDLGEATAFMEHALLRRPSAGGERTQLAQALRPLLDIVGKTVPGAAWIVTLLGLARPVGELLGLLQVVAKHPLPKLPPRERVDRLFDRLFEQLADNVAILVRCPYRLPDSLKRLLFQLCARRPAVVVAFTAVPEDETVLVAPGATKPPLRIELAPLKPAEVQALIARNISPNRLPSALADALWQVTRGVPGDIFERLGELIGLGILAPDEHGVWQLPEDGLEAAPLVRLFSYSFYDPLDHLVRTMRPERTRQAVERFLAAAVVCGDNVPADVVCAALGLDENARDEVLDFVDEHLVADEETALPKPRDDEDGNDDVHLPVFRDLQYNHPGLPHTTVYTFTHPIYRGAIHDRLGIDGWQPLAEQLLAAFADILPPLTRAAAEVHLSAVTFLKDEDARKRHLRDLAWWVDAQDCEALTESLTEQLARRELDPEVLWSAIAKGRSRRLLPHRRWALVAAYGRQQNGLPEARVGAYHLACGDVLTQLGQCRAALPHLLRAACFFQARNDHHGDSVARTRCSLCLRTLPKLRFALSFALRAVALAEACLDASHPDFGVAVGNLGLVLYDLGDYAGAKATHERALHIMEEALGTDHPDVADAANNLGTDLHALGDYAGAKAIHGRVLRILENVLGPDHPDVAGAANNLGADFHALGDYAGAKAAHERALSIVETVFGANHPNVAVAASNLAQDLHALGDYAGANSLWKKS